MPELPRPLPQFDRPPVTEVAISVAFARLPRWRNPHAGLFWSRVADEYPDTETKPPIENIMERFGDDMWFREAGPRSEPTDSDESRAWFLARPDNYLIQVQSDRFVVNWRKRNPQNVYPRYTAEMRPRFLREWGRFKGFVAEQGLGALDLQQCEVTYVNDILRGDGWNTFAESLSLFSPWWGSGTDNFLPLPGSLSLNGWFEIPEQRGRLRFTARHVRRGSDQQEIVQLQLVARGKPQTNDDDGMMQFLDLGREWIVRGFADLTSTTAHQHWGRTR
ncbi:TIGR04255 family protein [Desertibaculum subflavum]|uniref:TIGR04255 family protein n=1 Tax=Desertibaculum subflavum TaxID=2268458 RepID=UPI000E6712D9